MDRKQIESQYRVENGVIRSPGKFEGEPVYAPYFWDAFLNGMADDDDGAILTFDVTDEDRAQFPELTNVARVTLQESETGFVYCATFTREESDNA